VPRLFRKSFFAPVADASPASSTGNAMRERVQEALEDRFGERVAREATLDRQGGHASLRIYWRIELPPPRRETIYPRGERVVRGLALPAPGLPEGADEPLAPRDAADGWPFVNVQRYLRRIGLAVPDVDHVGIGRGVLLIEDLGPETFEDAVLAAASGQAGDDPPGPLGSAAVARLYRRALDLVIALHRAARRSDADPTFGAAGECVAFDRAFDREALRWELDHYREWGLHARLGSNAVSSHEEALSDAFDRLAGVLLNLPQTLALKDLQSRNLMRKHGRWHLIDFQDALRAPFVYDLVALLRDSYVILEDELVGELLDYYVEEGARAGLPWCDDPERVERAFHLQTVQRKLKDAGRFTFVEREQGKDEFLPYYAPSVGYVQRALDALAPEFADLRETLDAVEPALAA
jgi:aminoglycoside/choline kinase family phosphotransferase